MTIVSTRDFRANQGKYLGMALEGHDVVLRSRCGSFRLTPVSNEYEGEKKQTKRNVTAEVCQALKDWKEYLDTGKSNKFVSWEEMMDELRD